MDHISFRCCFILFRRYARIHVVTFFFFSKQNASKLGPFYRYTSARVKKEGEKESYNRGGRGTRAEQNRVKRFLTLVNVQRDCLFAAPTFRASSFSISLTVED